MDNMIFDYSVQRKYRHKLNMGILKSIGDGQIMAFGHGTYLELEKEPINWIAVKGFGYHDFAVYYGFLKHSHEYIRHNGEKVQGKGLIQEMLNCDSEVLEQYRI